MVSAQCNSASGGRVCNATNITYTWGGYITSTAAWKSVKVTQTGYFTFQLSDTMYAAGKVYFWEIKTCSKEDLQLQVGTGSRLIKRNLNTENCSGSNPNDERVVISGTAATIRVLGDSCNPTTDTFTLYYRRLWYGPSTENDYGSGNWIGHVFNYDNTFNLNYSLATVNGNEYMSSYGTETTSFTNDFGTGQPPVNGNCLMCPDSNIDNNKWGLSYRMNYGYGGGVNSSFYHIVCNTPNDLVLSPNTGGMSILNYWNNGSSFPTKFTTILLDSTNSYHGKWVYQTKKDTGNLKADVSICKMAGNYSYGNGEWKAYVFDGVTTPATSTYKTTTYDNYNGTFTNTASFSNNFGTGQPTMVGERCGVSMDNDSFYVSYKMKINLAAGKYKFRVKSEDGGYLALTNSGGTIKTYILNPGSTGSYDLTSSFYTLSGDTFLFLRLYEYTNTSHVTYVHGKEPKNPGGIHASKDTICNGSSVTLTADTADGTETQWYIKSCASSTGYVGSGASITVTIDSSTTFYVRNRSYSEATNDTSNKLDIYSPSCASKRIIMVSKPGDPANPTSNTPQCSNNGVTLTRNGTPASGESWYWQTANNGTATTNYDSTYNTTTGGTIYIRARNNTTTCWSGGAGSATVTVNAAPAAPTAVSPSSATAICNGASLNLNGTSTGNTIYWFNASTGGTAIGNSASASNYSVTPTSSVTYYAEVHTSAGCVSSSRTATGIITVNANPASPAAPTAQSTYSDTAYTFTFDSVTAGSGANQIEWALKSSFDSSVVISSGNSISKTVYPGAKDTIWLRSKVSTTGCLSSSVFTTASVNSLLKASISITPATDSYTKGSVAIQATGGNAPYTYLWSSGDTTAIISEAGLGEYTVTITDHNSVTLVKTAFVGSFVNWDMFYNTHETDSHVLVCTKLFNPLSENKGTFPNYAMASNELKADSSGTVSFAINKGGAYAGFLGLISNPSAEGGMFGAAVVLIPQGVQVFGDTNLQSGIYVALGEESQESDPSFEYIGNYVDSVPLNIRVTKIGDTVYFVKNNITSLSKVFVQHHAGSMYLGAIPFMGNTTIDRVTCNFRSPVSAKTTVTHVDCSNSASGAISVMAKGGKQPYHYLWSTSDTSAAISNLAKGSYVVTTTDYFGNSITNTVQVGNAQVWDSLNNVTVDASGTMEAGVYQNGDMAGLGYSKNTLITGNGETGWVDYKLEKGIHFNLFGLTNNLNWDQSSAEDSSSKIGFLIQGNEIHYATDFSFNENANYLGKLNPFIDNVFRLEKFTSDSVRISLNGLILSEEPYAFPDFIRPFVAIGFEHDKISYVASSFCHANTDTSAHAGVLTLNVDTICKDSATTVSISLTNYSGIIRWQKNFGTGWKNIPNATNDTIYDSEIQVNTSFRAIVSKDGRYADTSNTKSVHIEDCSKKYLYIDLSQACFDLLATQFIASSFNQNSKTLVIAKSNVVIDSILLVVPQANLNGDTLSLRLDADQNIVGVYRLANGFSLELDSNNYVIDGGPLQLFCDDKPGKDSSGLFVKLYNGVLLNPLIEPASKLEVIGIRVSDTASLQVKDKLGNVVYSVSTPSLLIWDGLINGFIRKGSYEYDLIVNGIQYNGKFLVNDGY